MRTKKRCVMCKKYKPLEDFNLARSSFAKRQDRCRACAKRSRLGQAMKKQRNREILKDVRRYL